MKLCINSESVVLLMNCENSHSHITDKHYICHLPNCYCLAMPPDLLQCYTLPLKNAIHLVKKVYIHFAQISTISHKLYVV